jgi:hypothetical protein
MTGPAKPATVHFYFDADVLGLEGGRQVEADASSLPL